MSFLKRIFGGALRESIEAVGDLVDNLHTSDEEKQRLRLAFEEVLTDRLRIAEDAATAEIQAKERVIVAEMTQGDAYTKRARPTVVYAGLAMIFVNYVLVPALQLAFSTSPEPFELPGEFWAAWGTVVGVWSLGRTLEKRGVQNRLTDAATGRLESRLLSEL